MADKVVEKNNVDAVEAEKKEVKDKTDVPKEVVEEKDSEKAENGDVDEKENGKEENGKEVTEDKVCNIKRKSTGGDAPDGTPAAEGATPEKKAKLDEAAAEAESNGEAEVAA